MIRINLIPPEYAEAQSKREQKFLLSSAGGVVLVVLMLFWVVKKGQATALQEKIVQADNDLRKYQAVIDQINTMETEKQKLISKRDVILNLNKSRLVYPVFFEDLLPLIPSDIWISDIKLDGQVGGPLNYKLTSKALSNYALATWLTNMQQSTHFSNVKLDRISYDYNNSDKNGQATLSFVLSFTYQHQGAMPLTEAN